MVVLSCATLFRDSKSCASSTRRRGVEFLLINSNLQDGRDAIAKEAAEFGIDFPILVDDLQLIGESLGVTRTADVFVVDPKTWKLVYRGPMDDRLSYGAQKPTAKKHYLVDALDAVLAGKPVEIAVGRSARMPGRLARARSSRIACADFLLDPGCAAAGGALRGVSSSRAASVRGP